MKLIITLFSVLLIAGINNDAYAQVQVQTGNSIILVSETPADQVSTPLQDNSGALAPQPGTQIQNDLKIIDGRKIFVDSNGIQSLAIPVDKKTETPSNDQLIINPE